MEFKKDNNGKATPREIDSTLKERGSRYGDYKEQSRVTQNIKAAFRDSTNWESMPHYMRDSLEMVAMKIGRTLTGDPFYVDNWHDEIGFLRLVEKILTDEKPDA